MPPLLRVEFSKFLPHGPSMCLLSTVDGWNESSIECSASTHHDPDNPLNHHGVLKSVAGVEYAAQAMAIHIGLTRFPGYLKGTLGVLGGLRDLQVNIDRLDHVSGFLHIHASLLLAQQTSFMYAFSLTSEETLLLKGRASIFIAESHHG